MSLERLSVMPSVSEASPERWIKNRKSDVNMLPVLSESMDIIGGIGNEKNDYHRSSDCGTGFQC